MVVTYLSPTPAWIHCSSLTGKTDALMMLLPWPCIIVMQHVRYRAALAGILNGLHGT